MLRGFSSPRVRCDGLAPTRTTTTLVGGAEWHFEYYEGDVYGATSFDPLRQEWSFVLFAPDDLPGRPSVVDHDGGFRERSDAIAELRKAALKRL